MPHWFSQSDNTYRSCVNGGNERTFSAARSAETATKISVAPMSIPAASGLMTGSTVLFDVAACLRFRAIAFTPYCDNDGPSRAKTGTLLNGIAASLKPAPERHHCSEHETRNQASYRAWQLHCSADLSCRR